jgi:hypothetical protein
MTILLNYNMLNCFKIDIRIVNKLLKYNTFICIESHALPRLNIRRSSSIRVITFKYAFLEHYIYNY